MSPRRLDTDDLRRFVRALAGSECGAMAPADGDADRIERVRLFEELKSAAAAAQADEAVAFDRSQRAAQSVSGEPASRQGRGVASQLALARRISPWSAQRWLGQAKILTAELPETFAELRAGRTSEWRALLVARETAMLSREDRALADAELAPRLEAFGDRRTENEARRLACRLDPQAAVERARNAEADRRVTIRPAPDTMCRVSALVPVAQGVATYASLTRDAATVAGHGDERRSRNQVMADLFVERITGQATAAAVAVQIELVITDDTLLAGADEPATVIGYGPVPAGVARDLALRDDAPAWLRRLYRRPGSRELLAMDSSRRTFTSGQKAFIRLRDQTCRTPWCDAPIRHTDHVRPHAAGGPTSVPNGDGLCEACNYARQAAGWSARTGPPDDPVAITIRTPTGHEYEGHPPELPAPIDIDIDIDTVGGGMRPPVELVWFAHAA